MFCPSPFITVGSAQPSAFKQMSRANLQIQSSSLLPRGAETQRVLLSTNQAKRSQPGNTHVLVDTGPDDHVSA